MVEALAALARSSLLRDGVDASACEGGGLAGHASRLLYRLVEPHLLGAGDRAGVERPSITTPQRRPHRGSSARSTYWADPHFEDFDPASFAAAVSAEAVTADDRILTPSTLSPTRSTADARTAAGGAWARPPNNLVVAATGTGKTIIAALDYRQLDPVIAPTAVRRLRTILRQSQTTFRHVPATAHSANSGSVVVGPSVGSTSSPPSSRCPSTEWTRSTQNSRTSSSSIVPSRSGGQLPGAAGPRSPHPSPA